MLHAIEKGYVDGWRLLFQFDIDPFHHYEDEDDDEEEWHDGASPFHTASQQTNTSVLEYFIELWNDRFASTGGRNSNGDAPIDILCREARVSIEAVTLLVKTFDANLSMATQGYFPFQSAINVDANLDVIYYLLEHWPDALTEPLPPIDPRAPAVNDDESSLAVADNKSRQPTIESLLGETAYIPADNESLRAAIELLQQRLATM